MRSVTIAGTEDRRSSGGGSGRYVWEAGSEAARWVRRKGMFKEGATSVRPMKCHRYGEKMEGEFQIRGGQSKGQGGSRRTR